MVSIRKLLLSLALLGAALPLAAQQAEKPSADEASADDSYGPQKFTCPVGGEAFEQNVSWSGYPLAARPDGGVLGSELTDMMIPECPGNGMVMVPKHDGEEDDEDAFAPYSPEELAKLPALIASPEYHALSKEARYYRLYWIGKKLGRPAAQQLHLLQHISYIMVPTPEQERRYLEFFVGETDAILAGGQADKVLQLRFSYFVANALRRLGRFDEARKRIAQIHADAHAFHTARIVKEPVNPHFEDDFGEGLEPPEDSIALVAHELLKAIEAGDTDQHPVSMMSDKVANSVCSDVDDAYPPATEMTKRNCAKRVAEKKAEQAKFEKEFAEREKLADDPANLIALCKATAGEKREAILDDACFQAEYQAKREKIEVEATKLLQSPKALDAQCKSVIVPSDYATARTGLGKACQQRREVTREAEATALAAKFRRVPSEFERLCTKEYPEQSSENPVERACYAVKEERNDARDAIVEARLAKMTEAQIWAECEKTNGGKDVPGFVMGYRCRAIESDREDSQWKALEADPAKLAAACALPDEAQEEWYKMRCYHRQEKIEDGAAMALAKDRSALLARCDATPVPQRDRILHKACSTYRKCIVMRFDELPYLEAAPFAAIEPPLPKPDQTVQACYDTAEQANAAAAQYAKDSKSLRANSCAASGDSDTEFGREACAAYARGEDMFADDSASTSDEAADKISSMPDCEKLRKKRKPSAGDAAAAGACAAAEAAK